MLFGLFAPHSANKTLNPALKLNSGLMVFVVTVDVGNPVKSVMLIIITEAPWRLEDAIHHSPPHLFFQLAFFPYTPVSVQWLWICGAVVNSIL